MAKTAVETLSARDDSAVEREHQVLYRKFRPRQFSDVVGQDHIIKTLQRKIVDREVGHAFLFVGPRGCGKTTTARLLAMASNCENLSSEGEPCGECATCNSIVSGSGAIGLHEIDAASNRGIGEMKTLIETMGQGSVARKKVYIIDECHMLTKEASNALLKTLEEPPADTLIILATTEANKVLDTIQSRATRYNFKLIDAKTMTGLIKDVVKATKMDIDDDGIAEVVRRGHGSPRDTLTALEGYGGDDAGDDVKSFVPAIADALAKRDSAALIIGIAEAVGGGADVADLTRTLLEHWRNCLLALEAPAALDLGRSEIEALAKQAKAIKANRVVRLLNVTAEALGNMNSSGDARILLETTLLQVSQPSASDSLEGIYDRFEDVFDTLDELTKIVKKGGSGNGGANDWPPADKAETKKVEKPVREEPADEPEPEKVEKVALPKVEEAAPVDAQEDDEPELGEDADEDQADDDSAGADEDPAEEEGDSDEDDYDQWDDELSDDDDEESDSGDDEGDDDSDDEEDKPSLNISDLIKDEDDSSTESDPADTQDDEHNHDEEEASGFLDCGHPDCVAKLAQVKKEAKDAPRKEKTEPEKDKVSKEFFEEKKAPTARDLVEIIQYDLIDRRFARYLQDEVMDAVIEEEDNKVFLVLTHKKASGRVPTKAAIDAITACVDNLWVDEIEYIGEER